MLDGAFWLFVVVWPIAVASLSKSWRDEAWVFVKTLPGRAKNYFDLYSDFRPGSIAVFTNLVENEKLEEARQYVDEHPNDATLQRLGRIVLTKVTVPTTDELGEDDGSEPSPPPPPA